MPLILVALLLFVVLAVGGVVLLSLALRYRAGTARRQARRWVVTVNVWVTAFSAVTFVLFSVIAAYWLGPVLRFGLAGMLVGAILGFLGLALTRWEHEPTGLYYTPSRSLALLLTLVIAARFGYGWWRITHPRVAPALPEQHWFLSASGTELSLAVGGGLITYYLVFALGVSLVLRRHAQRALAG